MKKGCDRGEAAEKHHHEGGGGGDGWDDATVPLGDSWDGDASSHLRQVPLLVSRHPPGLPSVLAVAQLGRSRSRSQAELLPDIVPQLLLARVLKILGRGQEQRGDVTLPYPEKVTPRGKTAGGGLMGAHLVAPHPVAGVHDERFPTVVVLTDVQATLGALIFYLWRRGGGGKRGRGVSWAPTSRGRDLPWIWALWGT